MDFDQPLGWAQFTNSALDAFSKVRAHFRNPGDAKQKVDAENAVNDAEEKLRVAKAHLGRSFGYPLCTCEFPPVLCLKTHSDDHDRIFTCSKCGEKYPVSKGKMASVKMV